MGWNGSEVGEGGIVEWGKGMGEWGRMENGVRWGWGGGRWGGGEGWAWAGMKGLLRSGGRGRGLQPPTSNSSPTPTSGPVLLQRLPLCGAWGARAGCGALAPLPPPSCR